MSDHLVLDLGPAAAVSDRGHRHLHNEDSFALAVVAGRAAVVVCDGVSTTAHPERASGAATTAALARLKPALEVDEWPDAEQAGELLALAICDAQLAVAEVGLVDDVPPADTPSTTIVAAIVGPGQAVVAHVGDSRAYLLSPTPGRSRLLTTDDSWAEMAIASGVPPAAAYADPQAHVITRWLGADSADAVPTVDVVAADGGDVLVVCTDGLWNYFESAGELSSVAGTDFAQRRPLELAGYLVDAALAAGGQDNVTVAVIPIQPRSVETEE